MARSIIDIDVKDESFKEFLRLFQTYKDEVKAMPEAWAETDAVVESVASGFAAMTATLTKQQRLMAQQTEERVKQGKEVKDAAQTLSDETERQGRAEENRARIVRRVVDDTRTIARNVLNTTNSLLQWIGIGSIFSGLMGAGGLWGLDRMARDVSDSRRGASGLGIDIGQLRSFNTSFQRYFDSPSNVLENVAEARSNYANRWAFSAMGINPNQGQNTAELAVQIALRAKERFDNSDQSEQSARAQGLLQFFTMDELRRLHSITMRELEGTGSGYRQGVRGLNIQDATARQWQSFHVQLQTAGQQIETVFIRGLQPLLPALTSFSRAVAQTIETLMASPHLREWIVDLGHGLESISTYLNTPDFQRDVASWLENVTRFVNEFGQLLGFIERWLIRLHIITPAPSGLGAGAGARTSPWDVIGGAEATARDLLTGGRNRDLGRSAQPFVEAFVQRGWTPAQAAGLAANIMTESSGNPFAHNNIGGGHYGLFQWGQARQRDYLRRYGHTLQSVTDRAAAMREQQDFAQYELTQGNYRNVGVQLRNATSAGAAGGLLSERYELPGNAAVEAQTRGGRAETIITVYNHTGSHVAVQTRQLAR